MLEVSVAPERQLAAEVFEDKVPDAADVALRTGPAAPAAAGPSADEALPALRPTSAEPQQKGLAGALPAVLRSRHAPPRPPRWRHVTVAATFFCAQTPVGTCAHCGVTCCS